MFPFTFSVPFSPLQPTPVASTSTLSGGDSKDDTFTTRPTKRRERPPRTRSSSPAAPINRKRGWEPSFAEPSQSATTLTSSSGYLDTPAKYRDNLATLTPHEYSQLEAMAAEELPPPAKRRRGLAGSIVSTAVSAALIGTAVGLTVYRLWRDRGRDSQPEQIAPPPPYHPGEWGQQSLPAPAPPASINILPPTPRRKTRQHQVGSMSKRTTATRRRPRIPVYTPPRHSPSPSISASQSHAPEDVEEQMDWIGDKLASLIEEGKKALGREVVVMSEAPEDAVDDGNDMWEEEDESLPSSSRRVKRRTQYPSPPPSARSSRFDLSSTHSRDRSADSGMTPSSSVRFGEDDRAWESPLLRESMELARARALKNRGMA